MHRWKSRLTVATAVELFYYIVPLCRLVDWSLSEKSCWYPEAGKQFSHGCWGQWWKTGSGGGRLERASTQPETSHSSAMACDTSIKNSSVIKLRECYDVIHNQVVKSIGKQFPGGEGLQCDLRLQPGLKNGCTKNSENYFFGKKRENTPHWTCQLWDGCWMDHAYQCFLSQELKYCLRLLKEWLSKPRQQRSRSPANGVDVKAVWWTWLT